MKSIRILITRHYDFDQTHHTEIWFRSIQLELSKYFSIDLIWLLYLPKKTIVKHVPKNENVEYIQDFGNALDVTKKLKPDLIISSEFPSLIDLAFLAASDSSDSFFIKFETIAVTPESISKKQSAEVIRCNDDPIFFINSFQSLFKTNSTPQLNKKNHATFNVIKFLLYKFNFLFRTLITSKLKFSKKCKILFAGIGYLLKPLPPYINSNLYPDLEFCNVKSLYELMIKKNYFHPRLNVVGEPIYDKFFKKRNNQVCENTSKPIQVLLGVTLFLSSTNGQKFSYNAIESITKNISQNKDEFSLSVKLHPSSHTFDDYEKRIHAVDESVSIFQKGNIESYIERSDVLVIFTQITSVLIYALILQKPVIICNFFNEKLPEGIEDLVFVCTDPSELQNNILEALETNHKKYQKIDEYLETACFKTDGLASERIVQSIISLMNNSSKN
jgi:hypothetical protein